MDSTAQVTSSRKPYRRRSDEERIADLEQRILDLKSKKAAQEKRVDPVLKEIPKIQRKLRKFAQYAMDNNRPDIANSVTAFNSSLERIVRSEKNPPEHRPVPPLE